MDANTMYLIVLLAAIASYCSVRWIYYYILIVAKDKNLVDNPGSRKLQKLSIPNVGGIVVFFGIVCGLLIGSAVCGIFGVEKSASMLPVFAAMVMMLYSSMVLRMMGSESGYTLIASSHFSMASS